MLFWQYQQGGITIMALELTKKQHDSSTIKNYTKTAKKPFLHTPRVNFSLKKEIFFVMISSIVGAVTMFVPRFFLDATSDSQYYITWLVFANIVNSSSYEVGIILHLCVATIIGIITGLVLHRVIKFDISKISNGLVYGIVSGAIVWGIFFLPVQQFVIAPNMMQIMMELDPAMTLTSAANLTQENFALKLLDSYFTHIIWGVTIGVLASLLTRKIGANYRCHPCDVQFSKIQTYENHVKNVHEMPSSTLKKIVILGGGYGGVGVLKRIQEKFENDVDISISIVSQDNFFLHTPMLPEMATGMVEPRHIATPVRAFCKRARFYQAKVDSINVDEKKIHITRTFDNGAKTLEYDYLVLALGGKTNFFGNKNIENNCLTIKTLGDAIGIRNHVITMLENADQQEDSVQKSKYVTFVVVGGGFSGVETIGELNDFVRESAEKFYRNIEPERIRIILVSAKDSILPEIGDLGKYAMDSLKKNGVEIITETKLVDAGPDFATLSNGMTIPTRTIIWAGGNKVDSAISEINTEHDKAGRVIVDSNLQLKNHPNVFALGDCAQIIDERTGKSYPPTAQHAIREAKTVSKNLISEVYGTNNKKPFIYDSKGSMAKIGKKNGVAILMGNRLHGIMAWFVWRQYYLATLPVREKQIRVALDWFADLFFPLDITKLSGIKDKSFSE